MYVTTWGYFRWELVMDDNLGKKRSPHQNQIPSVQRHSFSAYFGEKKNIYIYIYIWVCVYIYTHHICMMFQYVIFNGTDIVRGKKKHMRTIFELKIHPLGQRSLQQIVLHHANDAKYFLSYVCPYFYLFRLYQWVLCTIVVIRSRLYKNLNILKYQE